MITTVACMCGSVDSIIHSFLNKVGYSDWLNVQIARGRDKSLSTLNQLPPCQEKEELREYIKKASKWAIIIGYNQESMRWSDITHNLPKSKIDAEFIVKNFSI